MARRRAFEWPTSPRMGSDPLALATAALVNQRRALELTADPPSPEEQAEAEGTRSIVKAAVESFVGRVKAGDKMGETDIDAIVAKGVSRAMAMQLLRQASGGEPVAAPNAAAELTGMATNAAKIATDFANSALARETAARSELTQTVAVQDQRVTAAVQEERQQGIQYAGLLERILTREKEQEVAAAKAAKDDALERMEKLAKEALAAKEAHIEQLKLQHKFESEQKEKDHAHALALRDKDDALRAAQSQIPHAATAQEVWAKAHLETSIDDLRDEAAAKKRRRELENGIIESIKDEHLPAILPALKTGLGALLGQPVAVSDGPPPPPPEGATINVQ